MAHGPGPTRADAIGPGVTLGKYELLTRLAFGGMAEIWLARAKGIEGFEKHVVLKRILPQFSQSEKFVKMFLNEARLAATLDHPNIAQVHDIGHQEGVYFFVMEYLHGENLGTILKTLVGEGRRLPLDQAIAITVSTAAGLHFAHEKLGTDGRPLGLVHRDVSPSNLVVTYSGGVKLVDFGIAKVANAAHDLSKTNTPKGKAAYMSPEQCRNERLDRRSDVFSLGIVLHEITTMKRLFRAESELATLKLIEACDVMPPSAVLPGYPSALERIVMKALQREPDDRYATALDMQRELEAFAREHRLPISTAATAEFMEGLFGKKQEAWHALETPATPPPGPAVEIRDESRPAPRPGESLTRAMRLQPEPALSRRVLVPAIIATAVLAVGAGAVAAYVLVTRGDKPPPTDPVVLIAERGNVAVDPPGGEATAIVPRRDATPEPREGVPDRGPPDAGAARPRARPADDPFSRTFARKQGLIADCFAAHASALSGSPEIAVRFHVGKSGRPTSVDVIPAELASTPLGTCVAEVARATDFGPQSAPVTFRIPLKVRRK